MAEEKSEDFSNLVHSPPQRASDNAGKCKLIKVSISKGRWFESWPVLSIFSLQSTVDKEVRCKLLVARIP